MDIKEEAGHRVVGGVDTHKDLHVAAVVDERDRVLGTRCFATTRQGYRQMLAWMRSFGEVQRIGIESTGSYGAGLLRFVQKAGIEVLEVTTPDKQDRRRRGKNDDLDAQNAAHAAFAGKRTVTPRSRDGMVESLRVLTACRKTAVAARRVALQMIQNTIVCAPDGSAGYLAHHDPHAAHPDSGRLATGSDRLSRRGSCLPDQPQVACSPISRTARRDRRPRCDDRRHRRRTCARPHRPQLDRPYRRGAVAAHGRR